MSMRIFLSYRRDDEPFAVDRIFSGLSEQFAGEVFRDIDTIPLGENFRRAIDSHLMDCDVVIAVIGRSWLSVASRDGSRRLDDPADTLRLELQWSFERGKRVIPTLIMGARLPSKDDLPEPLAPLLDCNALAMPFDHFESSLDKLVAEIKLAFAAAEREREREQAKFDDASKGQPSEQLTLSNVDSVDMLTLVRTSTQSDCEGLCRVFDQRLRRNPLYGHLTQAQTAMLLDTELRELAQGWFSSWLGKKSALPSYDYAVRSVAKNLGIVADSTETGGAIAAVENELLVDYISRHVEVIAGEDKKRMAAELGLNEVDFLMDLDSEKKLWKAAIDARVSVAPIPRSGSSRDRAS